MNAIVSFRKCKLSDEELLRRVDQLTDLIYQNGRIPTRHIPARPNEDYDLLVGELILRHHEKIQTIKKFIFDWERYFSTTPVGQPPVLDDLKKVIK